MQAVVSVVVVSLITGMAAAAWVLTCMGGCHQTDPAYSCIQL